MSALTSLPRSHRPLLRCPGPSRREHRALRCPTDHQDADFLGALGLPVTYPDRFDVYPAVRNELLRRPSSLWLRPVGEGDQWRLLSFAFCGQFLPGPGQPEVYLRERGHEVRRLSVTDDNIVVALATTWIQTLAADEMFGFGDRPRPGRLSARILQVGGHTWSFGTPQVLHPPTPACGPK